MYCPLIIARLLAALAIAAKAMSGKTVSPLAKNSDELDQSFALLTFK
ncbi:MAG: hypothetical protein ACPG52_01005 [Cognaticolwellia sp.]